MLRRYYGKISKLPIDQFVGHDGELVVDDITGKVYVMDGVTVGGNELVGATPRFQTEPPNNPTPGALWYDPESGRTYIYYQSQWVDAAPNTTYVLPHASESTLGGIKVGLGLSIDNEGLVTANSHTPNELINGEYVLNLSSAGWVRFPEINSTGAAVAPIDDGISLGTDTGNVSIWPGPDNKWTFGTDGKLTLPVAGKIANGNNEWTFGLDGWLRFPEINATGAAVAPIVDGISLGTDTGNVSIWPGESQWNFNTDGNLTTPSGMTIGSAGFIGEAYGIQGNVDQRLSVSSKGIDGSSALLWAETYDEMGGLISLLGVGNGGVTIFTGNVSQGPPNVFNFDMDGNLSLPPNSTISSQSADLSLYAESNVNITSKGHTFIFDTDTVGRFIMPPSGVIAGHSTVGNGLNIFVGNTITEVGNVWTFGTTGNLTLPINGVVNYSNGHPIINGLASETFVTSQGYLTSVPTASNIQLGGVKVDNVSIVIDGSGTISSVGTTSVVPLTSTAPVSPNNGELWYDTNSGKIYVYIDDVWVDTTFPVSRDLSGIGSIGQTFLSRGSIKQLSVPNDAGKIITISTDVGVLRLPQITSVMLGATFEFYFDVDAGQIHIQSYYTGVRETTDVFRGSIFVGVDNATTGKLHKATATTSTACDLFLGQHHAKAGSYIKVKAIEFNSVGTWMFQGTCIGDTGQTPNSSDHPFQDYN